MTDIQFETWRDQNPFIEKHLHFPDGEDSGWGRVHAKWHEKKDGVDLTHICAFTLDLQSGDLYLDCSKRKIWTKCLALTVGRPLFGTIKTLYHLALPLSVPVEIFRAIYTGVSKEETFSSIAWNCGANVVYNLADIFRTPLYTTVLAIVVIAGVIIGPFAPQKLYDIRALAGRLELTLTRGNETWTQAPCFQPISNLMEIHKRDYTTDDTVYDQEKTIIGLNNLTRSYVNYRRINRNPFDNYGCLVPQDGAYVSPACG